MQTAAHLNELAPTFPGSAAARQSSSAPPPFGGATSSSAFALMPARDDTALYQDSRTGFSHLLPGRPSLGLAAREAAPPADATIHLQDAPITLRYRLEPPSFAAASAQALARGTAERYSSWRGQMPVAIDFANPTWLASWGVEAAAVGSYDVPENVDGGGQLAREDLFVLVRQGMVMIVSWTFPRGFIDDPAYATFASVAEATMVWDPARWEQRGRVWPESPFLAPGLYGAPKSKFNEAARVVSGSQVLPEERAQVLAVLSGVVSGAGAPWVPIASDVLHANKRAILAVVRNSRLSLLIDEAFAQVRTAHDLRGLAIILGRALEGRRTTSSLPPPMKPV